ncbi:MAG: YciI family protein [Bacteroidota bacterium]
MKYTPSSLFIIILTLFSMPAQAQQSFLYEITLFESFRHRSTWGDREHQIQKEHIAYLDSLTRASQLEIAGIVDQGLENHTGLIILTADNYEAARQIIDNDPSVKMGMMSARLRPVHIYFRKE